ncbi:MAG: quinolinate synthase NadA [Endomicrobia bacterium]|nr:quinolinate synthase NadA [Endomicrobiia bacterium]MDW8055766.1 quinolinate synthase NadA [Elusimicrobiota bacterium]
MNEKIIKDIAKLKKEKDAVVLVHNYQLPEVQDIADYLGDSLDLSLKARTVENKVIVFCGVHFMAETAYILSPQKIVLLPDITSGCPLADTINKQDVINLKKKYKGVPVVGYINTSAEVKSEIDYCCTSANAVDVVSNIPYEKVIFLPDKYLGSFVKQNTKKDVILWHGYCPVHLKIMKDDILKLKEKYPDAKVMVHPECLLEVQEVADKIVGTSGMIKYVREHPEVKTFIVGTEIGMCYRLKKEFPDKEFIPASELAVCPDMKKNTLEKILYSLETLEPKVFVEEKIRIKALMSIERMYELRRVKTKV